MKVIVSRGAGDNPAPDTIVDSLCTTDILGIKRGQAYLYDEGFDRLVFNITVKIPKILLCGDIIEFYDPDYGKTYRGKLTATSYSARANDDGTIEFSQDLTIDCFVV